MQSKIIPNVLFRLKARAVLKPMMPVVILCALIANLPSLAAQTLSILTNSDPVTFLYSQASTDSELVALLSSNEAIFAAFEGFLDPTRMASLVLSVIAFLLSPVLTLGLTNALLKLLRGQEIEVSTVFSRMNIFFKSLLLTLLTIVKILLWSLPGGLIMVGAGVLSVLTQQTWPLSLYFVGMTVMMVHMIRAMLHYAMSSIYLADDPTMGARAALKSSIALMKNRKMALLSLTVSVYLWVLIGSLVEGLISSMFGAVIASTLFMAFQMIISVYLSTCHCAFYDAYRQIPYTEA